MPMSRREYDQWCRAMMDGIFQPAEIDRIMGSLYPKGHDHARAELARRGVRVQRLPNDRAYSALELDQLVAAAELCGVLWVE